MSSVAAIAFWICVVLGVLTLSIWLLWPKRRNPVIRANPQPDSRIYSVGSEKRS